MTHVSIDSVASPAAVRLCLSLQHGVEFAASHWLLGPPVTHLDIDRLGFVPPCARSYWIRIDTNTLGS